MKTDYEEIGIQPGSVLTLDGWRLAYGHQQETRRETTKGKIKIALSREAKPAWSSPTQ